jgi:hypothetical protein
MNFEDELNPAEGLERILHVFCEGNFSEFPNLKKDFYQKGKAAYFTAYEELRDRGYEKPEDVALFKVVNYLIYMRDKLFNLFNEIDKGNLEEYNLIDKIGLN